MVSKLVRTGHTHLASDRFRIASAGVAQPAAAVLVFVRPSRSEAALNGAALTLVSSMAGLPAPAP